MKLMYLPFNIRKKGRLPWFSAVIAGCIVLFLGMLFSCKDNNRVHTDPVTYFWDFKPGTEGWSGGFADYPVGEEAAYGLQFERDTLPAPLDRNQLALKLSGNNRGNDLFMFAKRKITGLKPSVVYYATFTIEFATNEPGGAAGLTDAPGNNIYLSAGATSLEPLKIIGENNLYSLNISKCNQDKNGDDMVVVGTFGNDTDQPVYVLKTLANENPFHCVANEQGELWIIVGIDSGIQDTTTFYFNSIKAELF